MNRRQGAGLAVVLALVVGALVLRSTGTDPAADRPEVIAGPDLAESDLAESDLAGLRLAADLPPCATALTTDLPSMTLPCYDGGPDVQVSGAPGRPMLVNLWATWCAPCVDEVPDLLAFAERAGDRVGVVGVVHQDSAESVLAFADAFGITYPLIADDEGGVLRRYGAGPPQTLLVTATGEVAFVQAGAFDSVEEIEALVAEHLDVVL